MSNTLVMKFGGTSLGNASAISQVACLTQDARVEWPNVAVVVSAMSGVTSALLEGANKAASGDGSSYRLITNQLREKHVQTTEELLETDDERVKTLERIDAHLSEAEALCHAVRVLGELSPRALDAISSRGERIATHILSAHLREKDCPAEAVRASDIIRTDSIFQAANPDMESTRTLTRKLVKPILDSGTVPVITGFMAANKDGAITTLGRGGSDFSATIIASCLDADEVWIWTDVDGVMTADPRVAINARTITTVSYQEIGALAYAGAKVLHPMTVGPVMIDNIPLRIRNTFNPAGPTTLVTENNVSSETRRTNKAPNGKDGHDGILRAVTTIRDHTLITVEGRGMIGVQGIAARTFSSVAHTRTSVALITQASSEQNICFAIPAAAADTVLTSLEQEFRRELQRGEIDSVLAREGVVIVTAVGNGIQDTPGISGRIFSALGDRGVNVIAIAQGGSESSISLIVNSEDADDAVRTIHDLIVA